MKPYGKKGEASKFPYKCKAPQCGICTSAGWKIFKSRERCINYEEPIDSLPEYIEIENQVGLKYYCNEDGKEWFNATYVPLGISVDGVTPEHALDKMAHAYEKYLIENERV